MFLLFWLLTINCGRSQATECNDAYSCQASTISASADVYCNGYRSCDDADISTSSGIYCHGSYSCFGVTTDDLNSDLRCWGLFSCAYADSLKFGGHGECHGEYSCYSSTIYQSSSSNGVGCGGLRSCAESIIYFNKAVKFSGLLSGANTTLISTLTGATITFHGHYSGIGATVICSSGHVCNIECIMNGCNGVTLVSNGTFSVTCNDNAEQSDICPNGMALLSSFMTDTNVDFKMPYLDNLTVTQFEKQGHLVSDICNSSVTDAIVCDGDSECTSSTILQNTGPICCRGSESCDSITNGITTFNNSDDEYSSTAIRCDGYLSCGTTALTALDGGNIYITANLGADTATSIETTLDYNIYCASPGACFRPKISAANNVFCVTTSGCSSAWSGDGLIGGSVNSLFVYGRHGLIDTNVNGILNNMYCYGDLACSFGTIENITGSIYASGYQVFSTETIKNVENNIVGFGYQVFSSTTVNNVDGVYCDGINCIDSSAITSVNTIKVNGSDNLYGSTITSGLSGVRDSNIFKLFIYGSNTNSYTVTCNSNDICKIGCFESTACSNMNLYCSGTCYVDCSLGGCPNLQSGSYSGWMYTTGTPSQIPSSPPAYSTTS